MPDRKLLVESADYWFRQAYDTTHSMAERVFFMEQAVNHTENTLIAVLRDDGALAKMRARLAELKG